MCLFLQTNQLSRRQRKKTKLESHRTPRPRPPVDETKPRNAPRDYSSRAYFGPKARPGAEPSPCAPHSHVKFSRDGCALSPSAECRMRGFDFGGEPWRSSAPPVSLPPPYLPELSTKRASGLAPTRRWLWSRVTIGCSSTGNWFAEVFNFLPRPPANSTLDWVAVIAQQRRDSLSHNRHLSLMLLLHTTYC